MPELDEKKPKKFPSPFGRETKPTNVYGSALIGMLIGAAIGFLIGGPVGAVLGGIVGFLVGSVVGVHGPLAWKQHKEARDKQTPMEPENREGADLKPVLKPRATVEAEVLNPSLVEREKEKEKTTSTASVKASERGDEPTKRRPE